jgi:DHA2 family multidrug resistance protein
MMRGLVQAASGDSPLRRRLIMATTMLASSMYSLDLTVVSVALPHMQGTFSATPDQIAWVVTAFIVGATVTITLVGWLTGAVGRKRLFLFSISASLVITILCANAHTLEEEILWRFLLGLNGATIIPLSQVIAVDAYPRPLYGHALMLWSVGSVAGSIIAPPLAGYVIEAHGWPGVFYMNVPLAALALLGAVFVVPRESGETRRKLDVFGLVTLIAGLVAIQLLFNRGARLDWFGSTEIIVECIVAILCLYLFVAHSATARNPFLKPEPFRDRNYPIGLIGAFIYGTLWALPTVMLPLLLQNFRGLPVETIGLLLTPRQLGYLTGSLITGYLIRHADARLIAVCGFGMIAFSAFEMSLWSTDVTLWNVALVSLLQGIGCALAFIPFNTLAFATVPTEDRPQAVPLFYLVINLGSSIGIASTVTYWTDHTQTTHAVLIEHISPYNPLLHTLPEIWDVARASGISALHGEVLRQAGMIGYNQTFSVIMVAALCAAPIALLFRRARTRQ